MTMRLCVQIQFYDYFAILTSADWSFTVNRPTDKSFHYRVDVDPQLCGELAKIEQISVWLIILSANGEVFGNKTEYLRD